MSLSTRIRKFRPAEDLPEDFVVIFYGARRSGKSTMMVRMLEEMKDRFENVEVHLWSASAESDPAEYRFFPEKYIHSDIGNINKEIGELMEQQEKAVYKEAARQLKGQPGSSSHGVNEDKTTVEVSHKPKSKKSTQAKGIYSSKGKEKMKVGGSHKIHEIHPMYDDLVGEVGVKQIKRAFREKRIDTRTIPHKLIILDDVVHEDSIRYSPNLVKLGVLGRHQFFSVIILSQCITGSCSVPPSIRINSDVIVTMYNPRSVHERALLINQYLTPCGANKETGVELMCEITSVPYRAVVLSQVDHHSIDYSEFMYFYGPNEPVQDVPFGELQFGTKEQWREEEDDMEVEPTFNVKEQKPLQAPKPNEQIDGGRFRSTVRQTTFQSHNKDNYFQTIF